MPYEIVGEYKGEWLTNDVAAFTYQAPENNKRELFEWDNIQQFGTLAVVLMKNNEAVWTLSLNEDFVVSSDASEKKTGSISLYRAVMEENQPLTLHYKGPS